jgi:subtilisin-like proprotein convertase family protein
MKTKIQLFSVLLAMTLPVEAALYTSPILTGTTIPDNNYLGTGTTLQYTFSEINPDGNGIAYITSMTLKFTLAGGYGGDLTGYLRLGNQVNSPYYNLNSVLQTSPTISGSGVNFTVDVTSAFAGKDPNGTWTLFFADTSPVGQTTVNGWSLDLTAVPEPVNVTLAVFGVVVVAAGALRHRRAKAS